MKLDREEVWLKTFIAVAGSNSCLSKDTAINWADKAVEQFEEKFGFKDNSGKLKSIKELLIINGKHKLSKCYDSMSNSYGYDVDEVDFILNRLNEILEE